jgi:hypothetical protein
MKLVIFEMIWIFWIILLITYMSHFTCSGISFKILFSSAEWIQGLSPSAFHAIWVSLLLEPSFCHSCFWFVCKTESQYLCSSWSQICEPPAHTRLNVIIFLCSLTSIGSWRSLLMFLSSLCLLYFATKEIVNP